MAKSLDKQIHFVPDGKNFTDLEKMKRTIKPTSIDDEKNLIKILGKGDHVYCYIDPYDNEMSGGEEIKIRWSTDRQKAIDSYYISNDEI